MRWIPLRRHRVRVSINSLLPITRLTLRVPPLQPGVLLRQLPAKQRGDGRGDRRVFVFGGLRWRREQDMRRVMGVERVHHGHGDAARRTNVDKRGLLRRRGDENAAGLIADACGAHHGELPEHLRGAWRDDRGDGERKPVLLRHKGVQGRWCRRRWDRVHHRVCWYVLLIIVLYARVLMYVLLIGNSAEMCGGGWRINVYVQAGVTI